MKEIYIKTFDKLQITDNSSILEALIEKNNEINNNAKNYSSYKPKPRRLSLKKEFAISCIAIILILAVPYTRENVLATIKYIRRELSFDNGESITLIDGDNATAVEMTSQALDENKWCIVNDNKIIFIGDNKNTDITSYCSDTGYYRYETTDSTGITHIVFIGGDLEHVGWAEFLFDVDGNYLTNMMNIRVENDIDPEWLINAQKSLNIYYGE